MIKLTCSLEQFLFEEHRDILGLILFGHVELFTDEIKREYLEWCETEHGKEYLQGGSKYKPAY